MSDFNIYNKVPYNVVVPEFKPEREAPIYPFITRKYPCQEDVLRPDGKNNFGRLTWKIQQPDSTMVWSSVKLVLPLIIQAKDGSNTVIDMRVTSGLPACNVAVASTPMNAFRQTSLSINGKIFSEENTFRRVLDTCYLGTGPQSYGDNHSLKPVVSRNFFGENKFGPTIQAVDAAGAGVAGAFVETEKIQPRVLDAAFNLLEHNSPFLERARIWQDHLDYDGTTWRGDISSYLELGPFQARARKSNTAVPYIRDFHLQLNFDTNPSAFDSEMGLSAALDAKNLMTARAIAIKLLEFGTLPNMKHHGETTAAVEAKFARYFDFTWARKPYLEVTYTKYLQSMQSHYNLRCFEHQLQKSNEFQLLAPEDFQSPTHTARVTTRLLSYPTKIYLWADESWGMENSYISGGVRRSCALKNIHCRINQRPDVIFNPSQEECFEIFQRNTNSSLEYGTWLKSPIYCFTPVDLGQSDMFANDARQLWIEWDAEVSLTPLQIQEQLDSAMPSHLALAGYDAKPTIFSTWMNYLPAGTLLDQTAYWNVLAMPNLTNVQTDYALEFYDTRTSAPFSPSLRPFLDNVAFLIGQEVAFENFGEQESPTHEIIKITSTTDVTMCLKGFVWALVHLDDSSDDHGKVMGDLFYIPRSDDFLMKPSDNGGNSKVVFGFEDLERTQVGTDNKGDPSYAYNLTDSVADTIVPPELQFAQTHGRTWLNSTDFEARKTVPNVPGSLEAYKTDFSGIRNKYSGDADYNLPGPMKSGDAGYKPVKQEGTKVFWIPFQVSHASMVSQNATAAYRCHDAARGQIQGKVALTDPLLEQTGNIVIRVEGKCVRHSSGDGGNNDPNTDMRVPDTLENPMGYPMGPFEEDARIPDAHDYNLKALYEYGNAQYQFASDAMPTRVLPNLVPVRSAPGIPDL